ncbi:MAG: hypothetical protein WDM79_04730 [Terricaulis sp.]
MRQTLVLPNAQFFPKITGDDHEKAEAVFASVKGMMGLDSWPCTLIAQERTNAQIGEFTMLLPEKSAAGTFQSIEGEVYVTYDPMLLTRPYNLVTTFAHELAHYLPHSIAEPAPGVDVEPKLEELATEMAVAYHGFGVIAANAAFDFQQTHDFGRQGWSGGSWGYFSEEAWVFALAIFLALRDEDSATARAHLNPHLAPKLDKAMKRLRSEREFLSALAIQRQA